MTLQLLADDRHTGKTTQAVAWVSWGEQTRSYPGWSRVLLVPNTVRLDNIRRTWWGRLADFDHRVYALPTWLDMARGIHPDVEVCLDDLDELLRHGVMLERIRGRIVAATITAQPWQHVDMYPDTP